MNEGTLHESSTHSPWAWPALFFSEAALFGVAALAVLVLMLFPQHQTILSWSLVAAAVAAGGWRIYTHRRRARARAAVHRAEVERERADAALRSSEQRFRLLAEQSHDIIFRYRLRPEPGFEYVSPVVTAITGYTPEEHYADPMLGLKLIHPDDRPLIEAALAGEQDLPDPLLLRWYRKDGVIIWVEQRLTFVHDEHGTPVAVEGVGRDVTARQYTRQALREREAQLQLVVDHAPVILFIIDHAGICTMATGRGLELLGIAQEDILGMPFFSEPFRSRYAPADEFEAAWRRALAGETARLQMEFLDRFFQVVLSPLNNEHTASRNVLGVSMDITPSVLAEREQRMIERKLLETQKFESIGRLAGGIAHDFNNLLTPILGNIQLARDEIAPDSSAYELLEQAELAVNRAADLVRALLSYAGKGRCVVDYLNLNELVREMLRLLPGKVKHHLTIDTQLAGDLPPILADPSQVRQVLMNLLINAAQAIPETGGTLRVSTAAEQLGREELHELLLGCDRSPGLYVRLEIADNGIGMSAEVQAQIFDPFFTTKAEGRGLGLATVLGIVRESQGVLRVESEPGAGTTFTIWLPAAEELQNLSPYRWVNSNSAQEKPEA